MDIVCVRMFSESIGRNIAGSLMFNFFSMILFIVISSLHSFFFLFAPQCYTIGCLVTLI